MRWITLGAGVVTVAAAHMSVVVTLVVPRAIPSRLVLVVLRAVKVTLRAAIRPLRSYEAKDRLLAFQAPLLLLTQLALWLAVIAFGYGLVLWSVTGSTIGAAFRESGSSMLTLGFATTPSAGATLVDLIAAASGLVVVALQIAYLPVLYGAFSRREATVTLLESRAGAPAWGPELLWRHHRVSSLDTLPDFYREWERWCADLAETHTTYPILVYFRSPHPLRSWVTGLNAVLDSAAMYLSLCPSAAPRAARLCLRMGFVSLRAVAGAVRIPYDPDPHPDAPVRLTFEEFAESVEMLAQGGFPLERTGAEAWPDFRGWRVNYEGLVDAIADHVVAAPGPWVSMRRSLPGHVIMPHRPLDRTPEQPEGTDVTRRPSG